MTMRVSLFFADIVMSAPHGNGGDHAIHPTSLEDNGDHNKVGPGECRPIIQSGKCIHIYYTGIRYIDCILMLVSSDYYNRSMKLRQQNQFVCLGITYCYEFTLRS